MSYIKNGKKQYALKEKIDFHTQCANKGVNVSSGEKLTTTQRVRHANRATACVNQLNRFMKTGARFKDLKSKRKSGSKSNSDF